MQYQEDYPGGEHTLTEEERQTLEASSLQAKKTGILKEMMEEWKKGICYLDISGASDSLNPCKAEERFDAPGRFDQQERRKRTVPNDLMSGYNRADAKRRCVRPEHWKCSGAERSGAGV